MRDLILQLSKSSIYSTKPRKSCAFAVSLRMEALAIHILKEGMNGVEAAELLRREVARYEAESRGDWH
ncbi:DUF2732 family protein [Klebsiella pneumoniae]|uniref:DUF2732 family protein n=2 Tax=Klebsiella pneumoniae TaxID=573 RepID=UPI002D1F0337|nr:DUF2732 family protein [Klebsiella pneumoniae]MEB4548618.1 DUF2732 family protein [Klebsiella pneumoniae]